MRCPRLQSCPLHAQMEQLASLRIWQVTYCDREFDTCLRYRADAAREVERALTPPFPWAVPVEVLAVTADPG